MKTTAQIKQAIRPVIIEYVEVAYEVAHEHPIPGRPEPVINVAELVGYLLQHAVAEPSDFMWKTARAQRVIVRSLAERLVAEGVWERSLALGPNGSETVAYNPVG